MPRPRNRSTDLAPGSERARKSRGQDKITKAESKPLLAIEADPEWHPIARQVWEAGLESGQAEFYESSDLSILFLTCEGVDHWLSQGGRRSPELLRVLMQNLNSLLFTETDRRKAQIELERVQEDDDGVLASVSAIFE
ncbi:hypothetical protein [Nocardioides sp.]|uniref:phage terminase small subunit n=1 Tax=Nocardioides sp. TaxID=35761 RepID=UPI002BE36FB1|nr:hypothetical protein [Nocardioides sp.]HSX68448.1 hypothetical protein [Nocardioides sp.]